MFVTGLIFFTLLAGSFLVINFAQFKRFRLLEIAGHDEETTGRFLQWQRTKLTALRCGQAGWVLVFLTSVAVFPVVKTVVPLLAVVSFVVAAVKHEAAFRRLKKLPPHLVNQIKGQQGIYKFVWVAPAVIFGVISLVGLQKVSHMVYSPKPVVVKTAEPEAEQKPTAEAAKAAATGDQATIVDAGPESVPAVPAQTDPFAE